MSIELLSASSQYMRWDGSGSQGVIGANQATGAWTIMAAWFYPYQTDQSCAILSNGAGSASNNVGMIYLTNAGQFRTHVTHSIGSNAAVAPGTYTANAWNFGVGYLGGQTALSAWLNGSTAGSTTYNRAQTVRNTEIGSRHASSVRDLFFNGVLAHVTMWHTHVGALVPSDTDVANMYAGMHPLKWRPEYAIVYIPGYGGALAEDSWVNTPYTNRRFSTGNSPAIGNIQPPPVEQLDLVYRPVYPGAGGGAGAIMTPNSGYWGAI